MPRELLLLSALSPRRLNCMPDKNEEVDRLSAEVKEARQEAAVARASEENHAMNIAVLEANKKAIDAERKDAESRHNSQVHHLKVEVAEVRIGDNSV